MAETITMTIPEAHDERDAVLRFLAEKGLLPPSERKNRGKYAELARQYRKENILTGYGEDVAEMRRALRNDFDL